MGRGEKSGDAPTAAQRTECSGITNPNRHVPRQTRAEIVTYLRADCGPTGGSSGGCGSYRKATKCTANVDPTNRGIRSESTWEQPKSTTSEVSKEEHATSSSRCPEVASVSEKGREHNIVAM